MPWLNQGLADPAVTGLVVRTPQRTQGDPNAGLNTITPAANGAVTAEAAAGLSPVRNPIKDGEDIRQDGANAASLLGRGAGIVSNAATAAAAVPGPHQPAAVGVAATATGVDFVSKLVEQGLSPHAGKALFEIFSTYAGDKINERVPLIAPVTNEAIEIWKQSGSTKSATEWINSRWNEFVGELK